MGIIDYVARPSLLMNSSDMHSYVSMPVATDLLVVTDQCPSLLWLRPVTTHFLTNRYLEQINLFNMLHDMIAND
jgi:hypothetical protein